jgi:hypothetical protein
MGSLKIKTSESGTISELEDSEGILNQPQESEIEQPEITLNVLNIKAQLQHARLDFSDPLTFIVCCACSLLFPNADAVQILKRFSQLTGSRMPDSVLNAVLRSNHTLTEFIGLLSVRNRSTPKNFAGVLLHTHTRARQARKETTATGSQTQSATQKAAYRPLGPNVAIFRTGESMRSRETEIGRWKVIERELADRGLPLDASDAGLKKWRAQQERISRGMEDEVVAEPRAFIQKSRR